MKNIGLKLPGLDLSADLTLLTWTNIGLGTSLNPPQTLLLAGAVPQDDRPVIAARLAEHLASLKKKTLLIDLDRQGSRFKKILRFDVRRGFSDFLHHVFDEALLSRNVDDYGFRDLMFLCHYNRRSGQILFVSDQDDPLAVRFQDGIVVDVVDPKKSLYHAVLNGVSELTGRPTPDIADRLAGAGQKHYATALVESGLIDRAQLATLYDVQIARVLRLHETLSYVSFDFAGETNAIYEPVRGLLPALPAYFRGLPAAGGHILRQLKRFTFDTGRGITMFPTGQFPTRGEGFIGQFSRILPLLTRLFDVILVNAPVLGEDRVTQGLGRLLDGTVLVLKSGALERRHVRAATAGLRSSGHNLLGAVLSDMPMDSPVRL